MDLAKIKRLMDLRDFCSLGSPNIINASLLRSTKGKDSEQWAKDYITLNDQIVSFKEKYPELYTLKSFDHCEVNESKPKFPTGKKVLKTNLTNKKCGV